MRHKARHEQGFTMIELLVAMTIIVIIAAIATPIFINQAKANRDRATITDVTVTGSAFKSILIQNPSASRFGYKQDASKKFGYVYLDLNNDGSMGANEPKKKINQNPETVLSVYSVGPGVVRVYGWNSKASVYSSATQAVLYDLGASGIQQGTKNSTIGQP